MNELIWKALAKIAARPAVTGWLLRRAQRTPYLHIVKDGEVYMERYWLFNPYDNATRKPRWPWCPISIRIHVIRKPDEDRYLHDHPWDARTLILRGWYLEERLGQVWPRARRAGDTATLGVRQYHRINKVCDEGAVTLFISGRERNRWGYWVAGKHIPFAEFFTRENASRIELRP